MFTKVEFFIIILVKFLKNFKVKLINFKFVIRNFGLNYFSNQFHFHYQRFTIINFYFFQSFLKFLYLFPIIIFQDFKFFLSFILIIFINSYLYLLANYGNFFPNFIFPK